MPGRALPVPVGTGVAPGRSWPACSLRRRALHPPRPDQGGVGERLRPYQTARRYPHRARLVGRGKAGVQVPGQVRRQGSPRRPHPGTPPLRVRPGFRPQVERIVARSSSAAVAEASERMGSWPEHRLEVEGGRALVRTTSGMGLVEPVNPSNRGVRRHRRPDAPEIELAIKAKEWAEDTAKAQGLPLSVEDHSVISRSRHPCSPVAEHRFAQARQIGWIRSGSSVPTPDGRIDDDAGEHGTDDGPLPGRVEVRPLRPERPRCRRRTRRAPRRLTSVPSFLAAAVRRSSMGLRAAIHSRTLIRPWPWRLASCSRSASACSSSCWTTSASSSTDRARDTARCSFGESNRCRTASAMKCSRGSDRTAMPPQPEEAGSLGAEVTPLAVVTGTGHHAGPALAAMDEAGERIPPG